MTTIYIDGKPYDKAVEGARLVKEIERLGINISHRCGGQAMCTTCRVKFEAGEPEDMSVAEKLILQENALLGLTRLSCQILLVGGMDLNVLMPIGNVPWDEPGPTPANEIEPPYVIAKSLPPAKQ